ncbi:hypothetical protein C5167_021306 [Papaver somniferum]|uniref:RRM domain-containing protein n=1 Tax=Papaver somniferum TaxID=3469 RepID=A0A4Y7IYJ9_PAPSO|nr:hypothetical protein C5167_021306 [Papaver somniferum]
MHSMHPVMLPDKNFMAITKRPKTELEDEVYLRTDASPRPSGVFAFLYIRNLAIRESGDKAMVLCFVEFSDTKCALTAMDALQGEQIRIQSVESPNNVNGMFDAAKAETLNPNSSSSIHSLHLQILEIISPYTTDYIWQPFTLTPSNPTSETPHFHGKPKYGDNLEDEWFIIFLLFEISRRISQLSIQVWDTDGEFLLIGAAFHLPNWLNPETSRNRVFIRRVRAPEPVQLAIRNMILEYPDRARLNMHRVRVPVSIAKVLIKIKSFYDKDIDSMKYAARMEKFISGGSSDEIVYGQLVQQTFQAPKCYPMPYRNDGAVYVEAELGMKIACGFEMMYQQRPMKIWMASEMMSAPVRCIDEIFALPHSSEEFKCLELHPSDNDAWLYDGEDELKLAMVEREKELELYELKQKKSQKEKEKKDADHPAESAVNDSDLGDINALLKDIESVMGRFGGRDVTDIEEGSSSDMDTGNTSEDEELTPVDVDVNLVKRLLDSFSSQQGFPGPASNLLGLMGLQLPQPEDDATTHAASKKDSK